MNQDKDCIWCGDANAGFYHPDCAEDMSKGNKESVNEVLGATLAKLEKARKRVSLLSDVITAQTLLIDFYIKGE